MPTPREIRVLLALLACLAALASPSASGSASPEAHATIVHVDMTRSMYVGRAYAAAVEIQNTGADSWDATSHTRVTYRWLKPSGAIAVEDTAGTPVTESVPPGGAVVVAASVAAPGHPGTMALQWQVMQDGPGGTACIGRQEADLLSVEIASPAGLATPWLRLAACAVATALHFVLVTFWLLRFRRLLRLDADRIAFHAAAIGLGTLQVILHGLTFTVGLTLARGLVALALVHLVCAAVFVAMDHRRRLSGADVADTPETPRAPIADRVASAVGLVVLAAIAFQWMAASGRSLDIIGTDADHYHIPHAVNIALGVNPFGLPATHHFYPMGTSVLAAWFILPLKDSLLVDLTMLLPFLLAWFAIVRIIREATGRPGMVWAPWCALLLFSMPLSRASLDMSADLPYAATFLAVTAIMLSACARMQLEGIDVVSLALSAGMLLGTKVTGAFSLAALVGVFGAIAVARRVLAGRRFEWPRIPIGWAGVASFVLLVMAGGVWLVRNWYAFKSPIAPSGVSLFGWSVFPGDSYRDNMFYLSILDDFRSSPYYDTAFHAALRVVYWLRIWLGPWFLLSALALIAPAIWLVRSAAGGRGGAEKAATGIYLSAAFVLCIAHLALFAGVPWSSLEHYQGLSLRYALPCFALLFVAGYVPCLMWADRQPTWLRWAAVLLAAVGSISWYMSHQSSSFVTGGDPGSLTWWSIGIAIIFVGLTAWLAQTRPRVLLPALSLFVTVGAISGAWLGVRGDRALQEEAELAFDRANFWPQRGQDVYRGTYRALLASERASGRSCVSRRILVTTRWDAPLELQPPAYVNQLFDVRGPTYDPKLIAVERPGTQPCDYVIARVDDLQTVRGVLLLNDLKQRMDVPAVAEHAPFVVYRPVPRGLR
jgi:hypothetical protein